MDFSELKSNLELNGETENFVLYGVSKTDFTEELKEELENHVKRIRMVFSFGNLPHKIQYCYVNSEQMERYSGNNHSKGRANLDENGVVSVYKFHPHEITHAIMFQNLGRPHPFFEEGVAVLFGWSSVDGMALWKQKPLEYWKNKRNESENLNFEKIFDLFSTLPQDISYPFAGSAVETIIKQNGVEKFKKIYMSLNAVTRYMQVSKLIVS